MIAETFARSLVTLIALAGCLLTGPGVAAADAPDGQAQRISEQAAWLGVVDGRPVTKHIVRSGTHPEHGQFSNPVVVTTRWREGKIEERLFDLSAAPRPIYAKTTSLQADGMYREGYVFDGEHDYTATPAQPGIPWPLEVGQRRSYQVKYANGGSAEGWVRVTRVGLSVQVDGTTHESCVEVEGFDSDRESTGAENSSVAKVVYCKGVGYVSYSATERGWAITQTLTRVQHELEPRWDVPPPRCQNGKCGAAPTPLPTSVAACGPPGTCFGWSTKHGVAMCSRQCAFWHGGVKEGVGQRLHTDGIAGVDPAVVKSEDECAAQAAATAKAHDFVPARATAVAIESPQGRGEVALGGARLSIGAKDATLTASDGRKTTVAIEPYEDEWSRVPSRALALSSADGRLLGAAVFFGDAVEEDCFGDGVLSIALPAAAPAAKEPAPEAPSAPEAAPTAPAPPEPAAAEPAKPELTLLPIPDNADSLPLGKRLQAMIGRGMPVAILPTSKGLVAVSADGKRQEMLLQGDAPLFAYMDTIGGVVWVGHELKSGPAIIAFDLHAVDPTPIEVAVKLGSEYAEDLQVRYSKTLSAGSSAEGYSTCIEFKAHRSRPGITASPSAMVEMEMYDGYDGFERWRRKLKLTRAGKKLLKAAASRAAPAAAPTDPPKLPMLRARYDNCEDSGMCGLVTAIPGSPLQLVSTSHSCGDYCYVGWQFYDPRTRQFLDPERPGVTGAVPLEEGEVSGVWFSADGRTYLSGGKVVALSKGITYDGGAGGDGGRWLGGGVWLPRP